MILYKNFFIARYQIFKHVFLSSFNNKIFVYSNSSDFLKSVTYVVNKGKDIIREPWYLRAMS